MFNDTSMQQEDSKVTNDRLPKKGSGNLLARAKANFKKGNELQEQGLLTESILSYQKSIKLRPDYVQPLLKLAEVYKTQKNWLKATKCYRRAIGLNPDRHGFYLRLAEVLKQQNKIYGAIAAYAEAIELNPDLSAGVYKIYADLLVQKNDTTNDALLAYQKAADIRHDWHANFYVQLARLLMNKKSLMKQLYTFKKLLA